MAQTKRKFGKFWWVTLTVAVLMAVVFAVETPLCAYAEGTQEKYIKEVIMITAKGLDEAKAKVKKLNDDEVAAAQKVEEANKNKAEKDKQPVPTPKHYYLFETPIYDIEGVTTKTYLAYTTTNNVKKSLKAMKVMNMKGKWSYTEYNEYLDDLEKKMILLTTDLYEAIKEYATHLKAEKKNALYVKEILGYLKEDDSGKNVSDFFVDLAEKDSYEAVKNKLVTFFMQANKNILVTIECALMIACKDSYKSTDNFTEDVNFLTGMQSGWFLNSLSGFYKNTEYAKYDVYVDDILVYLPQIQEDIRFYMNSGHMLEDDAEQVFMEVQDEILGTEPENDEKFTETKDKIMEELAEGTEEEQAVANFDSYFKKLSQEEQESYTNGKMYYKAFTGCQYPGYNNKDTGYKDQYENLLGLFMAHEAKTTEELRGLYNNYDFYPFIDQLSPGQRGLLKVGLPQLISTTLGTTDLLDAAYKAAIDDYNAGVDTEAEKIKKGTTVSVYYEIDRSLFQKDSGIALTSEAIKATESEPLEHVTTSAETNAFVCDIIGIAAGSIAAIALLTSVAAPVFLYFKLNSVIATVSSTMQGALGMGIQEFASESFSFFGTTVSTTASTTVGSGTYTVSAQVGGALYQGTFSAGSEGLVVPFSECMSNFFSMAVSSVLQWISVAAIGVMILIIVWKYVYPLIATESDAAYIDIPRVMCSYEAVFGQTPVENCEPVKDYIYYYGVKNPLLNDDDNERANTRDGKVWKDTPDGKEKKDTDILKFGETVQIETTNAEGKQVTENVKRGGIGDIANWNLKGLSRQWVAIYTSNDPKAGNPILTTSLKVLTKDEELSGDKDLIPVKMFHENSAYDFHRQYAATVNKNQTHRYLVYKCDNTATTTTQTASVFSDISMWGGAVAGLVLGGGIGTLVTYAIIRKRKKKTV